MSEMPFEFTGAVSAWIKTKRWFPKSATDHSLKLVFTKDLSEAGKPVDWQSSDPLDNIWATVWEINGQAYNVPLVYTDSPYNSEIIESVSTRYLVDGAGHPAYLRAWFRLVIAEDIPGRLTTNPTQDISLSDILRACESARPIPGEQSNSSVTLSACNPPIFLKIFRALAPGINSEVELAYALDKQHWDHIPQPLAYLNQSWETSAGETSQACIGMASALVPEAADGYELFTGNTETQSTLENLAYNLGETTSQMHLALGDAFGKELPPTPGELSQKMIARLQKTQKDLPGFIDLPLQEVLNSLFEQIATLPELPSTIRIHGDYHLGQCLLSGSFWYITDFEGEPLGETSQRQSPQLALRDVAAMLRSFDYAGAAAQPNNPQWAESLKEHFITGYFKTSVLSHPMELLLIALEADRAIYELLYEAKMRPHLTAIPKSSLKALGKHFLEQNGAPKNIS